jgi:hypothetical protein
LLGEGLTIKLNIAAWLAAMTRIGEERASTGMRRWLRAATC